MQEAWALETQADESERREPRLAVLLYAVGMFVFALDVPIVSALTLDLVAVDVAFRLTRLHQVDSGFGWRVALLALAMGSYYGIASAHGYFAWSTALQLGFLGVAAYAAGYWAGHVRRHAPNRRALLPLLAGVAGAATYAFLSVLPRPASVSREIAEASDRLAPSAWGDGFVNATGLGARASLGLCLLPALLFLVREPGLRRGRTFVVLAAAVAAGLHVNLSLQNRGPFLGLAASLLASSWLFFRSSEVRAATKLARILPLAVAAAIVAAMLGDVIALFGIAQRFEEEGLGTARYALWLKVLSNAFFTFDGGRAYAISESHAHNLWLDILYDSGPFPFFLLVAFHLSHIGPLRAVFRGITSTQTKLLLAGTGTAFLAALVAEPALAMSISFFALSCAYLGLVLGLRRAGEKVTSH